VVFISKLTALDEDTDCGLLLGVCPVTWPAEAA